MLRLKTDCGAHVSDFTDNIQLCNFLKATKMADEYRVYDINETTNEVISDMSAVQWSFYNTLTMQSLIIQDLKMLHEKISLLDSQLNPKPVEAPAAS